jgi:hypothetical protein
MASRRTFLKSSGAAAALLGTMGLAGCSSIENALGGGGGGSKSYKNWMYDPNELVATEFVGFASYDVQTIYENEEYIPEEVFEDLEETGEQLSSFGVNLEETQEMVAMGHTSAGIGGMSMGGGGGGDSEPPSSGGTAAINGSFEPDEIEEGVETLNGSVPESQRMEEDGEYEGYTMWTASYEQTTRTATGQTQTQEVSAAAALSEETVVMGGMQSNEATGREAVEEMIDAQSGSGTRLSKGDEDMNTYAGEIINNASGNSFTMGVTLGDIVSQFVSFYQMGEGGSSELEPVLEVLDGLTAVGIGTDINGETYETNIAMVYEDSDAASTESYEDFFEFVREQNTTEVEDPLEDISTSKNGQTVVVTTTGDTEELFESAEDSASGGNGGGMEGTAVPDVGATAVPFDVLSFASPSVVVDAATPGGGVDIGN